MTGSAKRLLRRFSPKIALSLATLLICFVVVELSYRAIDPFPHFSRVELNHTEHGNLSEYDPTLGWRGVPGGSTEFTTKNNRVWLAHNRQGFRDVEHDSATEKPAVVFLGDSFTWGYEVEFDDMFVSRVRNALPRYEFFNLAHRGHGTDQQLLTFRRWLQRRQVDHVLLMFSENDVDDNNSDRRYSKPKPKFQIDGSQLTLTGTPVPRSDDWNASHARVERTEYPGELVRNWLFKSHFVHAVWFGYRAYRDAPATGAQQAAPQQPADLTLTCRILEVLAQEVEACGGELTVFFIPSRREFDVEGWVPYQREIAAWCDDAGIRSIDLAPAFRGSWVRTYYRTGGHWNTRGHMLAAQAIREHLVRDLGLDGE